MKNRELTAFYNGVSMALANAGATGDEAAQFMLMSCGFTDKLLRGETLCPPSGQEVVLSDDNEAVKLTQDVLDDLGTGKYAELLTQDPTEVDAA